MVWKSRNVPLLSSVAALLATEAARSAALGRGALTVMVARKLVLRGHSHQIQPTLIEPCLLLPSSRAVPGIQPPLEAAALALRLLKPSVPWPRRLLSRRKRGNGLPRACR